MTERAFLDVTKSLCGRRWIGPSDETARRAAQLVQRCDLSPLLAQVLAERGVAPEEAADFLAPSLKNLLPDPHRLRDMEKAASRFVRAIDASERIAIFADYDVDGASSAASLITYLRSQNRQATLYIPDRIDEGYGPNVPAMRDLASRHDLIVTVDCGTLSHEAIAAAEGCDVIVLDHHLGGETLPPALAVVNPNRQDEDQSLGHLCAAAVVFLFLVEVVRQRRASTPQPDLRDWLDLTALATIADVAPLTGVNRAIVRQGLKVMAQRQRKGLAALADVAGLGSAPSAWHLGFALGPRINAGGRVGSADLGTRLLVSESEAECTDLARKLDLLNRERRAIEAEVLEEAKAQAEARGLERALVYATGDGWHPGVLGIVSARLTSAANRPSIVIGFDDKGMGKGSGRSVAGVDLGSSVHALVQAGLIEKGGGHAMAAGLSLRRDQLAGAMEMLTRLLERQGAARLGPGDLAVSGVLMPEAASVDLCEEIEAAGPFGQGAPAPVVVFPGQRIFSAKVLGEGHLRLSFGAPAGKARVEAMAFSAMTTPLGPPLLAAFEGHGLWHLAGRIEVNTWQGRARVQLRLQDAAPA